MEILNYMPFDLIIEFNLFDYNIYLYNTQFELFPLIGDNHSFDYYTMQLKKYCWYGIWLWFQVEVYKTV